MKNIICIENIALWDAVFSGSVHPAVRTDPEKNGVFLGAVVAAYAPGGALGAAHHDDDVIAGIWSDGDE